MLWYAIAFIFATFFEKKVAPKNFQREVFSAHSMLDVCVAIIDYFLGSSWAPTPTKYVRSPNIRTNLVGRGLAPAEKETILIFFKINILPYRKDG